MIQEKQHVSQLVIILNSQHVVNDNSNRDGKLNVGVGDNGLVFIGGILQLRSVVHGKVMAQILPFQIVEISVCQKFWNWNCIPPLPLPLILHFLAGLLNLCNFKFLLRFMYHVHASRLILCNIYIYIFIYHY